jgi:hypothetical protein
VSCSPAIDEVVLPFAIWIDETHAFHSGAGDAMEQWRRRLSVNMDSAAAPDAQDAAADEAADDMTQDEDAAGGSYEFVPEGDRKQAGTPQLQPCCLFCICSI